LYAAYEGAVKVVYSVLKDGTPHEGEPIGGQKLPWEAGIMGHHRKANALMLT
jgi:hypothetical protein